MKAISEFSNPIPNERPARGSLRILSQAVQSAKSAADLIQAAARPHRALFHALGCALFACCASAADAPPPLSANDLAAKLSALQQDGASYVRLKLDVKPPAGTPAFSLQLQIKQRRSQAGTDIVYQVLWPKDRAGEAVLLRQTGKQAGSGSLYTPATHGVRPLKAAQMKEPLFGSDLTYADVLENFFAWENQKLVGSEVVDRVSCQILESKPGKGQTASAARVRTWVDTRRMVPLRVEKLLASGAVFRRIDTTRVASDDLNRMIPVTLTLYNPQAGSTTTIEGSKIKHGVGYTNRDFSPEGLADLAIPRAAP